MTQYPADEEVPRPACWRRFALCFVFALIPASALLALAVVLLTAGAKPMVDDGVIVDVLPGGSSDELILSSIIVGGVIALGALLLCFGAARNKGACLCLVAVLLLPLIGFAAAGAAVLILSDSKLTTAVDKGFDVDALRAAGDGDAADWLLDFFSSFALAYAFCSPSAEPLEPLAGARPWEAAVVCRTELADFSEWANERCLGAGAAWNSTFEACSAALLSSNASSRYSSDPNARRLFCACPAAIDDKVRGWLTNGWYVALGTCAALLLFAVCVMRAKKVAGKEKKRRGHNKLLRAEHAGEAPPPMQSEPSQAGIWGASVAEESYRQEGGGRTSMHFVTLQKDREGQLGLALFGEGQPLIEEIEEGTPAAESKLRVGDALVSINGKPTDRGHAEAMLLLADSPDQVRLQVTREV